MVNKVFLLGNVGRKDEMRHLDGGVSYIRFSMATNETISKDNVKTEWHNVILWRRIAEVFNQYVNVGDPVFIEGKLTTRSWTDKDGNPKSMTEVVGLNMQMLPRRSKTEAEQNSDNEKKPVEEVKTSEQQDNSVSDTVSDSIDGTAFDKADDEQDQLPF